MNEASLEQHNVLSQSKYAQGESSATFHAGKKKQMIYVDNETWAGEGVGD